MLTAAEIEALSELEIFAEGTPARFTDFCLSIGVTLTPGQRAYALVAFDGMNPCDLAGEERRLAREMFGSIERVPAHARRNCAAVFGGRGGKSYALGALRLLHLALTVSLHTLAPGEEAEALIVAPDKDQAMHTLQYVAGALEARMPQALAGKPTATRCPVRRRDGNVVAIVCRAATRGGSAVRGRSLVGVLLEECAFFRSDKFVVNDAEIFRAVSPRVLVGGQVLLNSTPWAEEGLLYDFYARNKDAPVDAIAARAPTLLMRDNEDTRAYVAAEYHRDPENAKREFGAEFMKAGAHQFFATAAIEAAMAAWSFVARDPECNVIAAGGDFAFTRNSAALAITVRDAERYTVTETQEKKPEGGPLRPGDVVSEFADTMERWGTSEVTADGHYKESIREHLETREMIFMAAPEGAGGKAETYVLTRQLLHQGKLRIPPDDRLKKQLKDVKARPTAGGMLSIKQPEWTSGEHGDIVSALIASVWAASRMEVPVPITRPEPGTESFLQQREEARLARWREKYEREQGDDNTWILGPEQ